MKMLSVKRNIIVLIIAVMMLIYGGQSISYSQEQNNAPELTPVCDRTQQVRDAIVAIVPGIDDCRDVTSTHLSVISNLNLSNQEISALKVGDFDGLSALTSLSIGNNELSSLPTNIFSGLSSLTRLDLGSNKLSSLHEDIFSGLTSLNRVYLSYNNLSSLPEDIFSGLSSLQSLALDNNNLSSLPAGIFSGLSSLDWLTLSSNSLSELPDGIFTGLSSLRSLSLTENSIDLSITVSLEKVGDSQFKAIVPIGAPFNIVLPLTISNGGIIGDATTITISAGSVESDLLNVGRTPNTTDPVTVEIGTIPSLPTSHYGYRIVKLTTTEEDDNTLSFAVAAIPDYEPTTNTPLVFIEGDSTTRSIPENTPPGVNIGGPVSAEQAESGLLPLLTYTLGGVDAASFGIESGTGQLKTSAPLDYETKTAYSVIAIVSDGHLTDSINITINVTDVYENNVPVFTEGESTSRSIAENTSAGENIGEPVIATDLDEEDVLTYTLGGIDAASFGIEAAAGQLLTKVPLDYETKDTYAVVVSVSDGKGGTDSISVTIYVTDVFENNPPVFTEGERTSRSIAENTSAGENIGEPVIATDLDEEDVLTYTLGGIDAASFGIEAAAGQLLTKSLLDYETKDTYAVIVSVSDGKGGTDTISVTIYVTDVFENNPPVFTEGERTSRSIAENTSAGEKIGELVIATDLNEEDVLTYTLGGIDAASFGIEAATGQLLTKSLLDYETKDTYAVIVSVSDGKGGTDTISVTIYVTDVFENNPPVFTEGDSTSRSIAENTPAGRNIGEPVIATDLDEEDVLTYSLGGVDAASFGIGAATGQLLTKAPLDYETKDNYAVIVSVSDRKGGTDTISVTIYVTDLFENNPPVFTEGERTSRSIAENTSAGEKIGEPVVATDLDEEDVLTYTLGGIDAASFGIENATGQLLTKAPLDYETKHNYAVIVSVSDGKGGTDTISVTIYVTGINENNPPVFTEGENTSRSIAENTSAGEKIGEPVVATDLDEEDILTYTLGGIDAASFGIEAAAGQLLTKAPLDFETKHTYAVSVSVSDGKGGRDSISVTIYVTDLFENNPPVFTEGENTSRSIAENTSAGEKIGEPVVATDLDEEDILTYTLGGIDAASFGIEAAAGQLLTKAPLDFETKHTYAVSVSVSDGKGGRDSISVTIYVTDLFENNPPVFTEGDSTSRSIAENTSAGEKIGEPVIATDLDEEDILTYTLGGIDAASFGIEAATGQLLTKVPLNFETKNTYAVSVSVSDGKGGTDTISVTINVTDVYENSSPVFVDGETTTRSIVENTSAGENIGGPVVATDLDEDVLTYTVAGVDAASFGIEAATGQLLTKAPLDYETKDTYAVVVSVSDRKGGTDTISVTINVTDLFENNPPVFTEGDSTSRSIAENTPAGRNIGEPVIATDLDEDVLTYSLGGVDAASFSIDSATGQLLTKAPLDFETKDTYAVSVSVSDGKGGTDIINVAINVTDIYENKPPVFAYGETTTRSIVENTPAGRNIGDPVTATDPDEDDTLTYSLSGTDADTFSIGAATGQLLTHASLDFETKGSYTVTVTVSDGSQSVTVVVTIIVIDVDESRAPVFADDRTTRSIAENTPAGVNIGSPVTATDADGDTLTYSLEGTDAATFSIVSSTGQLKTLEVLDFETKGSYTVTVTVSDGRFTASIIVIITIIDVDETPPPKPEPSRVSISEIMYGSESGFFSPEQWIELHNTGPDIINLSGWKLIIQNVDSPELTGPVSLIITFRAGVFSGDDAPRIWPNDVLMVVGASDSHSDNLYGDQIYNLTYRKSTSFTFISAWLSAEGFRIKLYDNEGNLVDDAGNLDGDTLLWKLPYGQNRGKTRAGRRTSLIRRYADSMPLNGTQAASWISAADANLTPDLITYYGNRTDISTSGVGIVINEISSQYSDYDINQDGVVNISDLVIVAGRLGQSGPNPADVNGDGVVNVQDLILVAGAIGQISAAPSLHPASVAMLTAADIQEWLTAAQGLDLTNVTLQSGIRFLEQLLQVLIPQQTELLPNFPNPFNPETWIPYRLAEDGFVTLTIYDQSGVVIRKFDVGHKTAAVYETRSSAIHWDGRNEVGDKVASSIYFYTLTAGDFSATRKMLILK